MFMSIFLGGAIHKKPITFLPNNAYIKVMENSALVTKLESVAVKISSLNHERKKNIHCAIKKNFHPWSYLLFAPCWEFWLATDAILLQFNVVKQKREA